MTQAEKLGLGVGTLALVRPGAMTFVLPDHTLVRVVFDEGDSTPAVEVLMSPTPVNRKDMPFTTPTAMIKRARKKWDGGMLANVHESVYRNQGEDFEREREHGRLYCWIGLPDLVPLKDDNGEPMHAVDCPTVPVQPGDLEGIPHYDKENGYGY